jgi:4-hydroxy-tetrahydrodipicolinate synthase
MPTGVVPVLATPFHPDGEVDESGFLSVLDHSIEVGAAGVMFPGFASEFSKLEEAERVRLEDLTLSRTRDQEAVSILSIPDHGTEIAIRRAVSAAERGADMVNVLPPSFLSPGRDAVLDHLHSVLAAVAPLPVVVQYAPQQGGILGMADVIELAESHANLCGVKVESVPPGADVAALASGRTPLPAHVGYAGLFLPDAVDNGVRGVQPGSSVTELYVRMWTGIEAGDDTAWRALHTRMLPYLVTWMTHVELIVAVEKRIAMRRGHIASDRCRRPGRRLTASDLSRIEDFLVEFADPL